MLVAVALAGGGVFVMSGLQDTTTYYRTPTEISDHVARVGDHIRVGGLVVQGSVHRTGSSVTFALTDGAHDVRVASTTLPPSAFRAGQGAVIEGILRSPRSITADRILVRHSNEYSPPPVAANG